jgi:hypothetical protein
MRWYAEQHPGSDVWRGGPLAHYAELGRHEGARLGPHDPGGVDLVEFGRACLGHEPLPGHASTTLLGPPTSASGSAGAQRVSAVVVADESWRTALTVLAPLLDAGSGIAEVLIATGANPTPEARLVWATSTLMAQRVRALAPLSHPGRALDEAAAAAAGEVLLIVTRPMSLTPDDLRRLLDPVIDQERHVDLAVPVVLAADDTVHSAGFVSDEPGAPPAWRGYPWADAARGGDRPLRGVSGEIAVVRRDAVLAAGGFAATDATTGGADEQLAAMSRRVAARGGLVLLVTSAAVGLPRAVGEVPPGTAGTTARPQVAARSPYADPAAPEVQRWAIKSPHPAGLRRRSWGDYHFALALAAALERLGHHTAVDPLDSWYRSTADEDHVTLTLRGLHRYHPSRHQVNLLWVISHPELVADEEVADADAVFAASLTWARRHSTLGQPVAPLLQCTDASLFRPEAAEPGTGYPLLFVGNSRSARRPLVEAALEAGLDLAVIGGGWAGRVPPGVVRAEFAPNPSLPALYRAAGVVLNDHWPDMARDGFLSNRLFDLTAAGARWVSDPAADLLDVFPTGRVASDAAELARVLAGAPASLPTEQELLTASDHVRAEHSFDARARELSRVAATVRESRDRRSGGAAHA